ncbi:hypothetical protein HJD18_02045 [Thermoleophilia bacterium SCSIO 60948]|nr:hypothetical protein HJD18_02045 [Thermoleophilia bacterium SCSIO 60948]
MPRAAARLRARVRDGSPSIEAIACVRKMLIAQTAPERSGDGRATVACTGGTPRIHPLVIFVVAMLWFTFAGASSAEAGSIGGRVTDEENGAGIGGACVDAYEVSGPLDNPDASVTADDQGYYTLSGLADAEHYVIFSSCDPSGKSDGRFVAEVYDDDPEGDNPTPVDASANPTGIDAALARAGTISGTVTNTRGGELENICVTAYADDMSSLGEDRTDVNGDYTVGGMTTGSYLLGFADCESGLYATEYFDDARRPGNAEPVAVTTGLDTQMDPVTLSFATTISGRVTETEGETPVASVCVQAQDADGGWVGREGLTDSEGDYTITDLPVGESFRVRFDDCGTGALLGEFYDDAAEFASADPVLAEQGGTSGIDAALTPGGVLSGQLLDEDGLPLNTACVVVQTTSGDFVAERFVEPGGDWRVNGLETGSYLLRFSACGTGTHVTEYWDDQPTRAAADPVSVTAGEEEPGLNARLARAGVISGEVTTPGTGPDGTPVCVRLFEPGGDLVQETQTDPLGGEYRLGGLVPGDYKVGFFDCGTGPILTEYFDDARTLGQADVITVGAGEEQRADATLELAPGPDNAVVSPRLLAERRQRQSADRIVVKVRAGAGERVRLTGRGKVKVGARRYALGPDTVAAAAGRLKALTLSPPRRSARAIARAMKRGARASSSVKVLFEDSAGNTATKTVGVRLVR